MTRNAPPRLAMLLLTHCLPDDDPLTGDLVEEFGTGRSRAWFWRQAMAAVAAAWRRPGHGVRPLNLVATPSRFDTDPRPEWPVSSGGPLAYLPASPVAGVGGLGLLAVIVLVTMVVPQIWFMVLTSVLAGCVLGIVLVRRTARRIDRASHSTSTLGHVLFVLCLVLAGAAPLAEARQTSGIILGRVVDGDTGDPVGGATVTLRPPATADRAQTAVVFTNGDGRFLFRDLTPGDYAMFALKAGRIPAEHGQRLPRGPGQRVTVRAGQAVTDATMRMWRFGAISGVVTDEVGEPVVGIEVTYSRVTLVGGRRVLMGSLNAITDDRGVYRLTDLSPGQYVLFVASTVESVATSTAMWYAEASAPAGAERELLQEFGESRAPSPSPIGLRLGDQIVSSMSLRAATGPEVTTDGRLEVYRTTFHPSATAVERATPVTVSSGEHREGVDLQLVREPAARVSGEVVGANGPVGHIGVRLLPADSDSFESDRDLATAATTTGQDGRFTLLGVPPGTYAIKVLRVPRPQAAERVTTAVIATGAGSRTRMNAALPPGPPATIEVPDVPTLWADQTVTVGDADVDGLTLQLQEGARVRGRIVFEGAAAPPEPEALARFAVQLTPAGGQRDVAFMRPPGVGTDGAFRTLGFPPGRYFVDVLAAPTPGGQWFLKSAMAGDRDLVERPVDLQNDDLTGVVITMTDRLGELTGTVTRTLDGDADALVALFPADHRAWIANGMPSSRTGTTYADADGRFSLLRLRPGAYLAVAVPADTELALQDPDVINRLARIGVEVQVPERGSASVRLSISAAR